MPKPANLRPRFLPRLKDFATLTLGRGFSLDGSVIAVPAFPLTLESGDLGVVLEQWADELIRIRIAVISAPGGSQPGGDEDEGRRHGQEREPEEFAPGSGHPGVSSGALG